MLDIHRPLLKAEKGSISCFETVSHSIDDKGGPSLLGFQVGQAVAGQIPLQDYFRWWPLGKAVALAVCYQVLMGARLPFMPSSGSYDWGWRRHLNLSV